MEIVVMKYWGGVVVYITTSYLQIESKNKRKTLFFLKSNII